MVGLGHIVDEPAAQQLEKSVAEMVVQVDPQMLVDEQELLRLLYAADDYGSPVQQLLQTATPELAAAVLKSARTEVKSQSLGSRNVRREAHLVWDTLVTLFGGEDEVRAGVEQARSLTCNDEATAEVVELADRYLSGWRPSRFGDDDD